MDVIADFAAYPEWAKGVKRPTVVAEAATAGPSRCYFELDVAPIKDEYTLAYDWDGDDDGHLDTWSRARCCAAMDGAYSLRDRGDGTHRGDLPARRSTSRSR